MIPWTAPRLTVYGIGGTFDGVSGTYTCTAVSCMGTKKDTITYAVPFRAGCCRIVAFIGRLGTWDFKPTSINSGINQDEDTEYLYFGIWVNEPNLASSAHGYQYIDGGCRRHADL